MQKSLPGKLSSALTTYMVRSILYQGKSVTVWIKSGLKDYIFKLDSNMGVPVILFPTNRIHIFVSGASNNGMPGEN